MSSQLQNKIATTIADAEIYGYQIPDEVISATVSYLWFSQHDDDTTHVENGLAALCRRHSIGLSIENENECVLLVCADGSFEVR